jgi:hypothetical protein
MKESPTILVISKERINRRNAIDEKNRRRNVLEPRTPQTNAEQRINLEESWESEDSNMLQIFGKIFQDIILNIAPCTL